MLALWPRPVVCWCPYMPYSPSDPYSHNYLLLAWLFVCGGLPSLRGLPRHGGLPLYIRPPPLPPEGYFAMMASHYVYAPPRPPEGYLAMVASHYVYVPNVSWADDFGIPWPLPPACTRALCYQEATR